MKIKHLIQKHIYDIVRGCWIYLIDVELTEITYIESRKIILSLRRDINVKQLSFEEFTSELPDLRGVSLVIDSLVSLNDLDVYKLIK